MVQSTSCLMSPATGRLEIGLDETCLPIIFMNVSDFEFHWKHSDQTSSVALSRNNSIIVISGNRKDAVLIPIKAAWLPSWSTRGWYFDLVLDLRVSVLRVDASSFLFDQALDFAPDDRRHDVGIAALAGDFESRRCGVYQIFDLLIRQTSNLGTDKVSV